MHLLNTATYGLETFTGGPIPQYAILSHTWGEQEVTFSDISLPLSELKKRKGFDKISYTCAQAVEDEIPYAWIDTCCIDKSSSAELSEAINSMYSWYRQAAVCYVYLSDMPSDCPHLMEKDSARRDQIFQGMSVNFGRECILRSRKYVFNPPHLDRRAISSEEWISALYSCKWFTRGWTIQELIAPQRMMFFGSTWNFVGSREDLLDTISDITRIDIPVLQHRCEVTEVSVAKRMSWAAGRKTTRPEDRAYCLLGIFGVNMALLYGEGQKAFRRLQEEILKISTDHTIFVWNSSRNRPMTWADAIEADELLATSPDDFSGCNNVTRFGGTGLSTMFQMTNTGLRIDLPLISVNNGPSLTALGHWIGILNCRYEDDLTKLIGLRLGLQSSDSNRFSVLRFTRGGTNNASTRIADVDICDVRTAKWVSALITRRVDEPEPYNLNTSIWIRNTPWEICDCYPPRQWNLRSRVMNRYRSLPDKNMVQLGGLQFRLDSSKYLIACFALIASKASEAFLGVRLQREETLEQACETLRGLLLHGDRSPMPVPIPMAACFQIDHLLEARIQLAYELMLGENVLVVDIETQPRTQQASRPEG